jgi:ADP-ribose pyrophosphatase YjhB (NUDIX family)
MASFYLAADALIEKDGEYLMIQEGKEHVEGTWNLPGGGVEHGENPVEAVKREVYEETGLKISEIEGLIGVFNSRSEEGGHPVLALVFSCTAEEEEPVPEFKEEILDAKFLPEEKIRAKNLRNDIILKALENQGNAELLPSENFSRYRHPYLDEEPGK